MKKFKNPTIFIKHILESIDNVFSYTEGISKIF